MESLNLKTLRHERDNKVLTLTFNRPQTMNAFAAGMHEEFIRALRACALDPSVAVVILTGEGKAFSAGGDLKALHQGLDDPEFFINSIPHAKELVFTLLDFPKPIIAKINGHAIGLGATIALLCDISFAANHARIADPHVQVGLVAGDGGAIIWPQLIGYAKAKEYLFTGDALLAPEAEKLGLINYAVPATELDARVQAFAQRLAEGAGRAIQGTKAAINIGLKQLANSIMDAGIAYEAVSARSADHREAVESLIQKRKPVFTGK